MAAKELWTGSSNLKKDLMRFSKEQLHLHIETLAIQEREELNFKMEGGQAIQARTRSAAPSLSMPRLLEMAMGTETGVEVGNPETTSILN